MQPYDKTSPYHQWVVSSNQLCSAVVPGCVLQLKPGTVFSSTSVVAVNNVARANQHLWSLDYISHQRVSLKCVPLHPEICVVEREILQYTNCLTAAKNTLDKFYGQMLHSMMKPFLSKDVLDFGPSSGMFGIRPYLANLGPVWIPGV